MTNDLISREAAVKLLCDKADGYYVSMFATSDECHVARIVALEAANEIESIPAVDAAAVVHGRWEAYIDMPGFLRCSECKDVYIYEEWLKTGKWNFCPNCGVRMDKEVDNAQE